MRMVLLDCHFNCIWRCWIVILNAFCVAGLSFRVHLVLYCHFKCTSCCWVVILSE